MCVAVGTMGNGPKMLAEKWNGRSWSVMRLAQPAGAGGSGLTGVSCTSARALHGGRLWRQRDTAVSCGSATSCTVVGYYDFGDPGFADTTLADHWDGYSWSSQPLPPAGNPGADLTSISCRPSACTAAGYYIGQSDEGPGTARLAMR